MESLYSDIELLCDETLCYERLPRFVHGHVAANDLPAIRRVVGWKGRTFFLTIMPASAVNHSPSGLEFGRRSLFPGVQEERVEMALRRLCNETNINFDARLSALCFSFDEFRAVYEDLTRDLHLTDENLQKSLFVLFDSNYVLKLKTREYYFRAIEKIKMVEQNGQRYYRIDFSPLFFDRGDFFDRIFRKPENH